MQQFPSWLPPKAMRPRQPTVALAGSIHQRGVRAWWPLRHAFFFLALIFLNGCFLILSGLAIIVSPLRTTSSRTFWTLWSCLAFLGLFRSLIRLRIDWPLRPQTQAAELVGGLIRRSSRR